MNTVHPLSASSINSVMTQPENDRDALLRVKHSISRMDLIAGGATESFDATMDRLFLTYLDDPDLNQVYLSSQRNHLELSTVVPIAVIICGAVLTRFNLENIGAGHPLFSAALASMILSSILFWPYLAARAIAQHTPSERRSRLSYRMSELYLQMSHKFNIEGVIGILAVLNCGLCLLARVYAGQCEDADVWRSQTCNPFADMGSIPNDQVVPTPQVDLIPFYVKPLDLV